MTQIQVSVTLKGPLFSKKIDQVVKAAMIEETLEKIGQRMERGGKGLGAKRNIISRQTAALEMGVQSTRHFPRTRGTAWTQKNVAIVKAMAPRVLRKAALRIAGELS